MFDHKEQEERVFKLWEELKAYEKSKERVKDGQPYYFLDGPPYVTGEIHAGTAWNKIMKDAMLRYLRMRGYRVRDTPGFDTHGLPIEVKVEQKLGFKNKQDIEKFGIENFIKECKEHANHYIGVMTSQFKGLGVWMDWENPYITYKNEYIERSWKTIKRAQEKGLLYEAYYVVPYCYRCQTTLAAYEQEYWDETDPSIYVKFKVKGDDGRYLIIWTTTPWTLAGNMAVAANPEMTYVEVDVEGERWIMAKSKLEEVLEKAGKSGSVIRELKGKELEGLEYEHPFEDKIRKEVSRSVVMGEKLVSEETGTGLVHIAPGHGPEDFELGLERGIEAFSPVNSKGEYTEEFEGFAGKNVKAANPEIIEMLRERGSLVADERIVHRYAHCWRCKTPLIFLKTKQWFFNIGEMKEKMLEEIEKVVWVPDIARKRFRALLEGAPNWNISRQRFWGIPLPIWKCECGELKVIGSREELPTTLEDLHRPYIDEVEFTCEKCKGNMKRVPDVLDVWFDSGNAVWATHGGEWGDVADLIMEGHDQIRGWFYSLLGCGLIYEGRVPYKTVVMHGFFVDEKGEKMSKSLGNFVPLEEIVARHGVDAFRYFSLSTNLWEDVRFNWEGLKEAKSDLAIVLNMSKFLERHIESKPEAKPEREEDLWILSRLNTTIYEYRKAMDEKLIAKAVREVKKFLIEDLSKRYMKVAKKRISEDDGAEEALFCIYTSLYEGLKLLAPIAPFTAEDSYQKIFKKFESVESIHLFEMPEEKAEMIDKELEEEGEKAFDIVSEILMLRNKAKVKLRWPLSKVIITDEDVVSQRAIKRFRNMVAALTNVKEILEGGESGNLLWNEEKTVGIDPELNESLWEEGIANDVARRIQMVRKGAGLTEKDFVVIQIGGDEELKTVVRKFEESIKRRVHASAIEYDAEEGEKFLVDGRPLVVAIKE